MSMFVEGTFPVAIKVLNGQTELKLKKFKLHAITLEEALAAQQGLKGDQYGGVAELCAATELLDDEGNPYELLYDSLMKSSSQNFKELEAKKIILDAKEAAAG